MQTDTTTYLSDAAPFIWESAVWFPVSVGLATVLTAELRLRLGPVEPWRGERLREAAAAVASVLAVYAVSALVSDRPEGPGTTLVVMAAVCSA